MGILNREAVHKFAGGIGATPTSSNDVSNGSNGGFFDPAGFFDKYNEQAQKATEEQRIWSAQQAQKQMDYQTEMANTQYQRAAKDMKAAGLNPYMLMNGAATAAAPTGAQAVSNTADVYKTNDTLERDKMIVELISTLISSATGIAKSFVAK